MGPLHYCGLHVMLSYLPKYVTLHVINWSPTSQSIGYHYLIQHNVDISTYLHSIKIKKRLLRPFRSYPVTPMFPIIPDMVYSSIFQTKDTH